MSFCPSCGTRQAPGARFCEKCGTPAVAPPSDSVFAQAAPPAPGPVAEVPPVPADSVFAAPAAPWAATPPRPPAEGFWDGEYSEPDEGRRPLVIGGVVLAALLAVVGGYVAADRIFGGDDATTASQSGDADRPSGPDADDSNASDESDAAGATPTGQTDRPAVGTDPLRPRSVTASCQAPPGVDAANVPVTYDPANTLDGVGSTAWRCPGSAVGQQLVFEFGGPVTLSSVGLVPGYDKIDPVDGTDRFGENRTVTGVTWRFDEGADHRQEIPSPTRAMAESRLSEPVTTTRVVLEITRTGNDGAIRDFTTISDVAFTGAE